MLTDSDWLGVQRAILYLRRLYDAECKKNRALKREVARLRNELAKRRKGRR